MSRIGWILVSLVLAALAAHAGDISRAAQLQVGDLIVVDSHNQGPPGNGVIVAINPLTGVQTLISASTSFEQLSGGALESAGTMIVTDFGYLGASGVFRVDLATGTASPVSNGQDLEHPTSVAIDSSGQLIVAQQGPMLVNGAVLRIDPVSGNQTVVSTGAPLGSTTGLAVEADDNYLVGNYSNPAAIVRVDAGTGGQSIVASSGAIDLGPSDVWINNLQSDSALVTRNPFNGDTGQLVEVDTITGVQTVISSGGFLTQPVAVTQDAFGNIFVVDRGNGSPMVLRIDPTTGVQTIVSTDGFLGAPNDILVYVPEPGSLGLLVAAGLSLAGGLARRIFRRRR